MRLRFLNKKHETGDIWSFIFDPIEDISWEAGQSIRLELPRPTWGISERRFTIASAPHEKHVQITTRMSPSEFKSLLNDLEPGQEIQAHNIEGDFTWKGISGPTLCIAGGIGITPFRALVLDAAKQKTLKDSVLLHRGTDNPALFASEFDQISKKTEEFSYRQLEKRVTEHNLQQIVADWQKRTVFISGSTAMVQEVRKLLIRGGLPENRLKHDIFTGNIS